MLRIELINMPFAHLSWASLGLTQLQGVVSSRFPEQVKVEVKYLNIDFSQWIGYSVYQAISVGFNPLIIELTGDWFFRWYFTYLHRSVDFILCDNVWHLHFGCSIRRLFRIVSTRGGVRLFRQQWQFVPIDAHLNSRIGIRGQHDGNGMFTGPDVRISAIAAESNPFALFMYNDTIFQLFPNIGNYRTSDYSELSDTILTIEPSSLLLHG